MCIQELVDFFTRGCWTERRRTRGGDVMWSLLLCWVYILHPLHLIFLEKSLMSRLKMSAGDISRIPVLRASYQIRNYTKIRISRKALVSSKIAGKIHSRCSVDIWFQFFKEKQHISQQVIQNLHLCNSNYHFQIQILKKLLTSKNQFPIVASGRFRYIS